MIALPQIVPVAAYTWEISETLLGTDVETGRVAAEFSYPVEILGIYPTVIDVSATAQLVSPTPDHLWMRLDIDERERFTNRLERRIDRTATNAPASSSVTLSAMSCAADRAGRLLAIQAGAKASGASVGFVFGWKRPPVGGVAVYQDVLISVAVLARRIEG